MRRPPRDPHSRILNGRSLVDLLLSGTVMGGLAVAGYLLAYPAQGLAIGGGTATQIAAATTVTYVTILCAQFANIVQRRTPDGVFSHYQLTNRWFWLACAAAVGIMLAIVYVPAINGFFGTAPLPAMMWLYVVAAAAVMAAARSAIARLLRKRG